MDPVTHTLVGFTLAHAGLRRRTALATPALVIGANLPDVDAVTYFMEPTLSIWLRRGITHGLPALVVWPVLLTGVMLLVHRVLRRWGEPRPVDARTLLWVSALAVVSHPLLDFLNNYGMRWLMPFSGTWFYGDTLFIVDPWMWTVLAAGYLLSRRRWKLSSDGTFAGRPARVALALMGVYVVVMAAANVAGRQIVRREAAARGLTPDRLMVSPVPVDMLTRYVVVQSGDLYHFATLSWWPSPRLAWDAETIDRRPQSPLVVTAMRGPESRRFLGWARFPYFVVEDRASGVVVWLGDARYTRHPDGGFGSLRVPVR